MKLDLNKLILMTGFVAPGSHMYVLVHLISVSECSPAGAVVGSSGRAVGEHRQ